MQISRHWRLNSLRYRVQGVRLQNGMPSIQNRELRQDEKDKMNNAGVLAKALFDEVSKQRIPVTSEGESGARRK